MCPDDDASNKMVFGKRSNMQKLCFPKTSAAGKTQLYVLLKRNELLIKSIFRYTSSIVWHKIDSAISSWQERQAVFIQNLDFWQILGG